MRLPGPRRASWLALIALTGCGSQAATTHAHTQAAKPRTTVTKPTPAKTTTTAAHKRPARGALPQTNQRPSAGTPAFHREMAALWRGVTTNSLKAAMPAYFPLRAYLQVKAIADAGADYQNRLLHSFRLDIAAAHALLGSSATDARLITVAVPSPYAHWVSPSACYNRVGYWEVPNARVIYSEHGQTRSFGIASMISWRGVWYVVHFGAVLSSGVVDDPTPGRGTSAPSSTC